MNQIRNLKIYCSCGKMNLFQEDCLNNSCKAVNRVYCLKCDQRIEHFACQNNLKDEKGLIDIFEDFGKKIELYIKKLQKCLQKIFEKFNELTYKLKCEYNQLRLQELNESRLKAIIFQFQSEFEKSLENEIQNCSEALLIQLMNWIKQLGGCKGNIEYHPSVFQKQKDIPDSDLVFELFKRLPVPTKFDLDSNIKTIQNTFKFHSIEINQQSFENNITQIEKIRIPNDYTVVCQGNRCCVRTLQPIVFSESKELYLMKIKNSNFQDEVFFLKMPKGGETYRSMDEAIEDSISHLISKRFMQKFVSQLNEKGCNIPPIRFSDCLILQENEKSFWIAERLYQGDFVIFNNNFGFINSDDSLLNNIAQVFSVYTYYISEFSYLICNLQGVGCVLTDPAIQSQYGNFGETDFGSEGIGNIFIAIESDKKNVIKNTQICQIQTIDAQIYY